MPEKRNLAMVPLFNARRMLIVINRWRTLTEADVGITRPGQA
jgi:hypothetical protein